MPIAQFNEQQTIGNNLNPITDSDIVKAIQDTTINNIAIDTTSNSSIYKTLLQYPKGIPVIVEYYRRKNSFIRQQTIDTSFSLSCASVQYAVDLIHNLEMRFKEQLDTQINPSEAECTITGEGIIYPGLIPLLGDLFLFKLLDSRIGIFVIDKIQPLSISHLTHYAVNFHLLAFLNEEYKTKLKEVTIDELYYIPNKFFADQTTLLSSKTYIDYNYLLDLHKKLINLIVKKFYNRNEHVLLMDNRIYDPNLIEFLQSKVDAAYNIYPLGSRLPKTFDESILYSILTKDISTLQYTTYLTVNTTTSRHSIVISNIGEYDQIMLTNNPVVSSDITYFCSAKSTLKHYIFSPLFYYYILRQLDDPSFVSKLIANEYVVNDLFELMIDDPRIKYNAENTFYSLHDTGYHTLDYFTIFNKSTGSNNNIGLPELEYVVFSYLFSISIDIHSTIESILKKIPFPNMKSELLYYTSIFLHIADVFSQQIK